MSTHYIQQSGLVKLKEWGLLERLVATGCPPMRHMTLSFRDIMMSGFAAPKDGVAEAYAPRRTVLDELLVDAAREAGAEVREGCSLRDVIVEDGRVVGVLVQEGDGPVKEERARIVVGADGRHSSMAKLVDAPITRAEPAACFIYYSYFSGIDWPFHHRTGYGHQQMGAWPTNDGQMLVATMRRRAQFDAYRADPDRSFQAVLDAVTPDLGEDLRQNGVREEKFFVSQYPDNYYRRSAGPGWALVGDAGYHKDPFTGQGISDAFRFAGLLAERIAEGLSGERPLDEAVEEYARERDEDTKGTFELTCSISDLELTPFYDRLFRATSLDEHYTTKFFGLVAGLVPGEEFFDPESLARLYESVGMTDAALGVPA